MGCKNTVIYCRIKILILIIYLCTVNCRSLSTAWTMYAMANDDRIVSARTGYWSKYTNPWVDWAGPETGTPANIELQIQAVEQGMLYPYVEAIKAYRCPASRKDQVRCYTIPDIFGHKNMGDIDHSSLGGQKIVLKTTKIKSPSERIIFLDEDDVTFGGFTINFLGPTWWDRPPSRHSDGVTLGYADGHSGYYKWKDKRTIDYSKRVIPDPGPDQPDNEDIMMMQRGIFGKLGY